MWHVQNNNRQISTILSWENSLGVIVKDIIRVWRFSGKNQPTPKSFVKTFTPPLNILKNIVFKAFLVQHMFIIEKPSKYIVD